MTMMIQNMTYPTQTSPSGLLAPAPAALRQLAGCALGAAAPALALAVALALALALAAPARAADPAPKAAAARGDRGAPAPAPAADCPELLRVTFNSLQTGKPQSLCQYKGKVLLVVNTASYCGYTGQYEGLEALYRKYRDRGLVVVGFPSNDYGAQEPGTNQEIAEFCRTTYGVEFPMFEKAAGVRVAANPLYAQLIKKTGQAPQWNFHKYLVTAAARGSRASRAGSSRARRSSRRRSRRCSRRGRHHRPGTPHASPSSAPASPAWAAPGCCSGRATRSRCSRPSRRLGGHSHTVDVTLDGVTAPVDTGFLVFNDRTYPRLIALFDELGVASTASDMSFSVRVDAAPARVGGHQPRRAVRAAGQRAAARRSGGCSPTSCASTATTTAMIAKDAVWSMSLGEYLDHGAYSAAFRDWYLLPMAAAIWSSPKRDILDFPLPTFVRFCHNHGLLQIADRPQWRTVVGGARDLRREDRRRARRRAARHAGRARPPHAAAASRSTAARPRRALRRGRPRLPQRPGPPLLADPSPQRDAPARRRSATSPTASCCTPTRACCRAARRAWAAWNYLAADDAAGERPVAVSYLINRLQPLPFAYAGDRHAEPAVRARPRAGAAGVRVRAPAARRPRARRAARARAAAGRSAARGTPAPGWATASTRTASPRRTRSPTGSPTRRAGRGARARARAA